MRTEPTRVWEEYRAGLDYQSQMGFAADFPLYEAFKEGDQWPAPTRRTRNLPRPVFNVVDMFIRTKRSAIVNQPITIQYTPSEYAADELASALAAGGARDFTDYARQLWESCEQDELNSELVDDAATLGTGVLHYYFDADVRGGGERPYIGEIRGETIDPLNIFFGDPQCRSVQRQPYIIIAQRVDAQQVQELARAEGVPEDSIKLIAGDERTEHEGYDAARRELKNRKKVTLLTKYYREGGAVLFDRCTELVEIITGRSLTPEKAGHTITRYPVVVLNWYKRKKSIFGIGECQTLIPPQRAINFLKAMELLSAQQTAWPKMIVKPGAIHQPVTNEPGEMITDYYGNGTGVAYLSPPAMSSGASALAQSIFDLMRTVSGVNEVTTGEPIGSSIAASAIIALQSQAKKPIEEVQSHYWRAIKQVGAIWEDMIKAYYNTERNITSPEMTEGEEPSEHTRAFLGSAYADVSFRLRIDVGTSSEYSEALAMSTLDSFLAQGFIDQFDYVELAPQNVVPFREQLKKRWADKDAQKQAMLQQVLAEAQGMAPQTAAPAEAPSGELPGMVHPAGVGGASLPAIPKAPGIPALQKGD